MLEGLQCLAWRLCFLVMIKNEWRVRCRRSNIDAVNCVNWRPFLFQNYTYSNKKSWNVSCSTALFVSSSALFQLPAHLQNLKWRTRIPNGGWKRALITLSAKEFFLFLQFQPCMTMHSTMINQSFNILLKERKELTSLCRRATFKSLRFALILTSSLRAVDCEAGVFTS